VQQFRSPAGEGVGSALMLSLAGMCGAMALVGLGLVVHHLPAMSAAKGGLQPPEWLTNSNWVKPSIMIMGLWAAIGSQTMLLYIAALMNVPGELYEAADIDGASRRQKFWNVTWPQLAPTTFFVVVMGVIGGLQAGFEVARVMTRGGPAGSSTTLAYFIYNEGFETGRLGFSSAVSWTMFLLVLIVTLFNWKFGGRYVNE
jgi:multiple sugar transport system permease protein